MHHSFIHFINYLALSLKTLTLIQIGIHILLTSMNPFSEQALQLLKQSLRKTNSNIKAT